MKNETKLLSPTQLVDLQRLAGKAFMTMPKSNADKILSTDANQKAFIQKIKKLHSNDSTKNQNETTQNQVAVLIDYYQKVFGIDISEISDMAFPEHETFKTYMAVSPLLNEDQIMDAFKKYFNIGLFQYKTPIASSIDRDEEKRIQKRSSGLYVFAHSGQDEPDQNHRGKSYNDAVAEQMIFANIKEYLLITGFHKFTKNIFMDKNGWTRTSSLWSDGSLVGADWHGNDSQLRVGNGYVDFRYSDFGPRQLIL
jgi:hypothetical protein